MFCGALRLYAKGVLSLTITWNLHISLVIARNVHVEFAAIAPTGLVETFEPLKKCLWRLTIAQKVLVEAYNRTKVLVENQDLTRIAFWSSVKRACGVLQSHQSFCGVFESHEN